MEKKTLTFLNTTFEKADVILDVKIKQLEAFDRYASNRDILFQTAYFFATRCAQLTSANKQERDFAKEQIRKLVRLGKETEQDESDR